MTANGAPPADRPQGPRISLDAVPTWLQALAAVATVIVSAVALVVSTNQPPSQPTGAPSAPARRVIIETLLPDDDEVRATGVFERVDPESEAVLLIGQPATESDASWVPVEADMSTESTSPDGTANGRWAAARPIPNDVAYRWYAVVAPRLMGAGEDPAVADIRRYGPESRFVSAASEVLVTDR